MRFLVCLFLLIDVVHAQSLPLNKLTLPPGFTIEIYAQVPNARQMALGTNNTVFVGSMSAGKVYAITPNEKNSKAVTVRVIASGLNMPTAVDFKQGSLYVGAVDRILRFDNIEKQLDAPPAPVVITSTLPDKAHHGWRFMRFAPDNQLYIGIGAPCNVCLSKDPRFATISRMQADGSQFEIYAKGIRNTVGFDWDPLTQHLWFTENGRDWLGDNQPPDEINLATKPGMNFGFPYCHGKHMIDPAYGNALSCKVFTPPTYELPAHVAALGMRFYTGKQFPDNYHHQLFIAEHGSWNRSAKTGYQVVSAELTQDRQHINVVKPFITGWLQGETAWGRPVDLLVMPDGSLLISDDLAGVIYRVRYQQM